MNLDPTYKIKYSKALTHPLWKKKNSLSLPKKL
jgi:hypothetical protein